MERFIHKNGRLRLTEGNVLDILRYMDGNGLHEGGGQAFLDLADANPEFHEPDQQEMTYSFVHGDFDNAMVDQTEAHIVLKVEGKGVVARLNLCLLLALAADRIKVAQDAKKELAEKKEEMGF
jgi:hypothetical protein